jgi:UDP-N-acetylmuramyl tripeptide synthase
MTTMNCAPPASALRLRVRRSLQRLVSLLICRQADVVLRRVGAQDADFEFDGETVTTAMKLRGVYNIFNAAAALSLAKARCICGNGAATVDHAKTR